MPVLLGLMNRGEYGQPVEDELDQLVAAIQVAFNRAESASGSSGDWDVAGSSTITGSLAVGGTITLSTTGTATLRAPNATTLWLQSAGDVEVRLDSDNNGSNSFKVVSGGAVDVFTVDESGNTDIASTAADALDVEGGAQFGSGNVALIGTDGKINGPLSTTILDDLSGANLTTLNASNISSGTLAAARGGTGIDSSGSTGVAQVSAGTWSASTTLQSAVQDNITRLGTIVSGVWNGTDIALANLTTITTASVVGRNTAATGDMEVLTTLPNGVQDNITRTGTLVAGATGAGYTVALGTSTITGQLGVANGGTGLATLAANRIPYGNGTSALQSSASLTFDGTTFKANTASEHQFSASNAAGTQSVLVQNTSNTASSNARVQVEVGGASAGDPYFYCSVGGGGADWIWGIDNSDSDSFKLGTGVPGTNTFFQITTAGEVTAPSQPGFLAYNSANDLSQANGATIDFDTEVYDDGADFAADTFTAPVTGRYLFCVGVSGFPVSGGGAEDWNIQLVTSNRTYRMTTVIQAAELQEDTLCGSVIADMDAADTASVQLQVPSAGNITILGGATLTHFSGRLLP